jgi:5'-nucleotidase
MLTNRRHFIKTLGLSAAAIGSGISLRSCAHTSSETLTILHTNDVHSQIDPFPADHPKHAGKAGFARRAALIEKIRKEAENVLLLDAGDIFQGTPYFNFFKGELELKLMSKMGYDAATFGNHEFDNGIEELARQASKANFPFLNCNYTFKNTPLENQYKPYITVQKGNIKVGITGMGIELNGLVDPKNTGGIFYHDPFQKVEETAALLRYDEQCDMVIALSHLGYHYRSQKISDQFIAQNTKYLDLIIGGHTHSFMDQPETIINKHKKQVIINQVGWAGINIGRIDVLFGPQKEIPKSVPGIVYHIG